MFRRHLSLGILSFCLPASPPPSLFLVLLAPPLPGRYTEGLKVTQSLESQVQTLLVRSRSMMVGLFVGVNNRGCRASTTMLWGLRTHQFEKHPTAVRYLPFYFTWWKKPYGSAWMDRTEGAHRRLGCWAGNRTFPSLPYRLPVGFRSPFGFLFWAWPDCYEDTCKPHLYTYV